MNWLFLALLAFSISSFLCFLFSKQKNKKSSVFYRIGGMAIISSFVISLLLSEIVITSEWQAILVGSVSIAFFGLWDDFKNLNWKKQLFFQFFLALILIWFGYEIGKVNFLENELFRLDLWHIDLFGKSFSIVSSLFIAFWLMILINSVNWLDGSDGLLSVTGVLALLAVLVVSFRPEVNQPALVIVSLIGIGSLLGFLVFNFPKAKIEAGTSGSYFVGFILASLAVIAGTKISTTMIILILPVADFIWVIFERFKAGQSIFQRDDRKRHLHYKLLEKGFSSRQILLIYTIFLGTALVISFFVVNQLQKIVLLAVEFLMVFIVMFKLSDNLKNIKFNFKKIFSRGFFLVFLLIVISIFFSFWQKNKTNRILMPERKILINSNILEVEIAKTPIETYQGLSGIEKIADNQGMLFIYENLSTCPHVMRGMLLDLDFVFLKNEEVIFVEENVPKTFKGVIESRQKCNRVLEINSGMAEKLKIKKGDKLEFID